MDGKMNWNPWHGCYRISEGCKNCYVFDRDESFGRKTACITKTSGFDLPIRKSRLDSYKVSDGCKIYTCMTSDFFIDFADQWRPEAWEMIHMRN